MNLNQMNQNDREGSFCPQILDAVTAITYKMGR